jgi:hypothetical protein
MELQTDFFFSHDSGSSTDITYVGTTTNVSGSGNAYVFSGNYLYNFERPGTKVSPFAGAGLGLAYVSGRASGLIDGQSFVVSASTAEAGLQLLGGVQVPINGRRAFRGELRVGLYSGTVVSVLGGLAF